MGKNTSISLGKHFDDFMRFCIEEGRYKNASEVVRAGLRLLEEEEQMYYLLKEANNDGMESKVAVDFYSKEFLKQVRLKKLRNGGI